MKLHRDYSSFQMEMFKVDLDQYLKCINCFEYFQSIFTRVLHNHVPIKKKIIRFNNNAFLAKTLRKAIMHRSKYFEDVLDAFNSHPSIERIRRTVKTNEKFPFQPVLEDLVREIILNIDGSKATSVGDTPEDMLKSTVDIRLPFTIKIINFSFQNGCFSDELKLAEVSPISK